MKKYFQINICLFFFCSLVQAQYTNLENELKYIDQIRNDTVAYQKLISLTQRNDLDDESLLKVNHRIIERAFTLQEFGQAVKIANASIELASKNDLDSMEAYFLKLLGITYYFMDQKIASIPYFEKAALIAHENNLWELEASCYNNIGGALTDKFQYEKAEGYLLRSISIMKEHGAEEFPATLRTYRVLARLYSQTNQDFKAEPIYLILIDKGRLLKDTTLLTSSLTFYSELLGKRGEVQKALEMGEEAVRLMRLNNDPQMLQMVLGIQSHNFALAGRYKEAYNLLVENMYLVRKNFENDLEKEVSNMEVKYKTEQIKRDKENAEQNAKKQRLIYGISFAGAIMLVVFGFFLWNQRKNAVQRNELQQQKFENLIEGEEKERLRIARDLHDGIVQDLTAVKMKLQTSSDNKIDSALLKDLDDAIYEVRNISYRMMPVALKEHGLIHAIDDLLRKISQSTPIQYEFELINMIDGEQLDRDVRFPEKIELCLYRVTQELLNNVVKHSEATKVSITITKKIEKLTLFCEDDGKGFDELKVQKGIGMSGLLTRVQILNGSISFQSPPEGGTLVITSIPLV